MIRGLSFITDSDLSDKLFRNLNLLIGSSVYEWYIDDVDYNYFCVRVGKYTSDELASLSGLSFLRIRCYQPGTIIDIIDDYSDYIKSYCAVLILFYDGGIWEIYAKNDRLIDSIYSFCTSCGVDKIKYITDDNDVRVDMHF